MKLSAFILTALSIIILPPVFSQPSPLASKAQTEIVFADDEVPSFLVIEDPSKKQIVIDSWNPGNELQEPRF